MSVIDDATLLKMAEAEILGEAKRAAVRHSIAGVSGWRPCPKPNKLFLANTLLHTVTSNRLLTRKLESRSKGETTTTTKKRKDRKLLQSDRKKEINFVFKKPDKISKKLNEVRQLASSEVKRRKKKSDSARTVSSDSDSRKHDSNKSECKVFKKK